MSITANNAQFLLSIAGVFNAPQQLQGFAADNIFSSSDIQSTEGIMGADGILSAGFVFMAVPMTIALQADSLSMFVFDNWAKANQLNQDAYRANASILLQGLKQKWTLTNGTLTTYKPLPDAQRVLQPRHFTILWERVVPAASSL